MQEEEEEKLQEVSEVKEKEEERQEAQEEEEKVQWVVGGGEWRRMRRRKWRSCRRRVAMYLKLILKIVNVQSGPLGGS